MFLQGSSTFLLLLLFPRLLHQIWLTFLTEHPTPARSLLQLLNSSEGPRDRFRVWPLLVCTSCSNSLRADSRCMQPSYLVSFCSVNWQLAVSSFSLIFAI